KTGTPMLEPEIVGIAWRNGPIAVRGIECTAVGISQLVSHSMELTVRYLKLERMVSRTQRTVIEIHRRELRIQDKEILLKSVLSIKTGAADSSHVGLFEEICQLSDVPVSEH